MPNIATVLKEEITRLARKEIKGHTNALKKASSDYRKQISDLKRKINELERQIASIGKKQPAAASVPKQSEAKIRFSAKALRVNRERLGLSVSEFGKLIGASDQSVYNWEQGKSRPRKQYLAAYAEVRALGKRGARVRLQEMDGS